MTTAELLANLREIRRGKVDNHSYVDVRTWFATIDEAITRIETTSPGSLNSVGGIRDA